MPKSKEQKKDVVAKIKEKLNDAKSLIFVNFSGIDVSSIQDFRRQCRVNKSEYIVAKKTLIKKALDEQKIEGIDPRTFANEVGMVFSYGDEVIGAKTAYEFKKKAKSMQFVGGLLNNDTDIDILDATQVESLAMIPCREELLAKAVGSISAPLSGLVGVLGGTMRSLLTVLNGLQEKKS